ncbi:ABC transporter permease [Pseudochelatococcus sp. G4_1912]|uniref:ABC transporter permease n=1 Tax=Pseudochelatococcus sp. G4_1912 TaxID=3114288 RepID=UPI0039C6DD6F
MELAIAIMVAVISAATPLLLAATGELVVERAGVLNLGIEGMMLMGAMAGFAAMFLSGSHIAGLAAAIIAGVLMASVFAFLTLTLSANQVASGLALTIFGIGLSALIGSAYVGQPVTALPKLNVVGLTDLPVLGPLLFSHDGLVYFSMVMIPAVWWFLNRSRAGLKLRAVGESAEAAHALGHPVIAIRYAATLFGGAMAGLAGAFLSLSYTPMWAVGMTAGRGWIALALVVFAAWKPWRLLIGAYLFGGVGIFQLHVQGAWGLPSELFSMLPYVATIVVLTIISISSTRQKNGGGTPAALGKPFRASI